MSDLAETATIHQHATAPTLIAPADESFASAQTAIASPSDAGFSLPPSASTTSGGRTTVLPRITGEGAELRLESEVRTRYEPIKLLGTGGMGEVVLVQDQDISRKVAIKRLLPQATDAMLLARFIDEIRTVGRLEHPNIVPVHDVGMDENGRYFFVMRYVEGETLEEVIKKLRAGDAESHRIYSFERRVEIMISVLNALEYAHVHGIVHRDIKHANVMVGRYGEVVLMDWGIATPIDEKRDLAKGPDATIGQDDDRGRMYMTHVGTLVGTPAYMSPEQARGDVDKLDARSDLYSACVMLLELVTLKHYLEDEKTTADMLGAIIARDFSPQDNGAQSCRVQSAMPPELMYVAVKGLAKDPAQRPYQTAAQMIDALQGVLAGTFSVDCKTTMTKRMFRELARAVDKHPRVMFYSIVGVAVAVLFAVLECVRLVVT